METPPAYTQVPNVPNHPQKTLQRTTTIIYGLYTFLEIKHTHVNNKNMSFKIKMIQDCSFVFLGNWVSRLIVDLDLIRSFLWHLGLTFELEID